MPWEVSGEVEKRQEFLAEYASGEWSMTDLCRAYGITPPTGYAVLRRFGGGGTASSVVPTGLPVIDDTFPAINRWAYPSPTHL